MLRPQKNQRLRNGRVAMAASEAGRQFSQPIRQFLIMVIVIGLVAAGAFLAQSIILPIFDSNPYLNGVIAGVFVVGVLACFGQVFGLMRSVSFIGRFLRDEASADGAPSLMAPFTALLVDVGRGRTISASSSRTMLESVGARMEESRDITRYITNLLIFLGLLGTFYGLATTVPAMVDTIKSLKPDDGEGGVAIFGRLMGGLEQQLGGMGTAFASSLLGLSGSLVVGLLELFAGHGQNRFYRELEDWLSTITRVGISVGDGEAGSDLSAFDEVFDQLTDALNKLGDMSERVGDKVEGLQGHLREAEAARVRSEHQIGDLARAIEAFAQQSRPAQAAQVDGATSEQAAAQQKALENIAAGQQELAKIMKQAADVGSNDARNSQYLNSINVQMLRIIEELADSRAQSMAELRPYLNAIVKGLRPLQDGHADSDAPGRKRV